MEGNNTYYTCVHNDIEGEYNGYKNRMTCVMTYTLTHALNYCFVFVKLLPMFAMCTYPETAKNML